MITSDFQLLKYEDGALVINMAPPIPIGGWTLQFAATRRFGSTSGLIVKNSASGYNGVSGITVMNSGQGQFQIAIYESDTSGLLPGNYAYTVQRQDSGEASVLAQGYLSLTY
jgi:hypothetical protein